MTLKTDLLHSPLRNRASLGALTRLRPADLFDAWLFAEAEATLTLREWWQALPLDQADRYAAYVAALDREAHAAEVLAARLA